MLTDEASLRSWTAVANDGITRTDAIVAGFGALVAYPIGAAIPLAITVFAPVAIEAWAIVEAVAMSLVVTSVVGARAGQMRVGRTIVRTLAIGLRHDGDQLRAGAAPLLRRRPRQ